MPQLVGLKGVKGALLCQHVGSVAHALRRIPRRRAITASGSTGAINVWRDDTRILRSEFMRHRMVLSSIEHRDMLSLRVWLETWWPEMEAVNEARSR